MVHGVSIYHESLHAANSCETSHRFCLSARLQYGISAQPLPKELTVTQSPVRLPTLHKRKRQGDKIVMVTAYDASFARLLDGAGVDILLVGDSLGMVIQGHRDTLRVTLEHMVYHTACVSRATLRAHVVADMPFMSYQVNDAQAVASAGRLVQEGGAHAVKLEGGYEYASTVRHIVRAGIPVMGHIGLTPQRMHELGGFVVQGRDTKSAEALRAQAHKLQEAGCYAIVLEGIPQALAGIITRDLDIPTIGIGAGAGCDGQVLVCYDLLGLDAQFAPKFVKRYAALHAQVADATRAYVDEVKSGAFPAAEHCYDPAPAGPHASTPLYSTPAP